MNKVKTIKVKNEDGSISEESYAIAADALNIDMANGKNVQETIGTIDVDKDGDIAAQLNKKIKKSDIIDNLDSSDNNKVLSAKQGKVLNEAVAAVNLDIKKKIYYFNTVTDMKADIDLQAGDTCQTLGYYSANDRGGANYLIKEKTQNYIENGNSIIEINNNLIAEKLRIIEPNKNFDLKLGTTTLFDQSSEQGIIDAMRNINIYFTSIIQSVVIKYDIATSSFKLANDNNSIQIKYIQEYINNGGKIYGLKFHRNGMSLNDLFETYGSESICTAYTNFVLNYINALPYKNLIKNVWIMNEEITSNTNVSHLTNVINSINIIKEEGYNVSIPFANIWHFIDIVKKNNTVIDSCSYISLNLYPMDDYFSDKSSIEQVAERFNYNFEVIERFIKNKDLYITEFGCSSSWDSFSNPSLYKQDGVGKPISLLLEGFYKSKFIQNIKGAFLWYYFDAYTFAPDTLLSIKNNEEVRY